MSSQAKKPAPSIDPVLVEWLERLYPDRLPENYDVGPKAFGCLVGQQNVIRTLKNELRRQTKDDTLFK